MDGLDVSKLPLDLILSFVNIFITFIIVRLLVYKPVKKFMSDRAQRLEDEKISTKKALDEADAKNKQYETLIADAKIEADSIISSSEDEASEKAAQIIAQANEKSKQLILDSELKITAKEKAALENMKSEVIDLAVDISAKLLEKNIDNEENRKLAASFFDEIEKLKS